VVHERARVAPMMLALEWILLAAACVPQESARGFRRAVVALEGPLEEAQLREPSGSQTRIECSLGPGAHLLLAVPVSAAFSEVERHESIETRPAGSKVEVRSVESGAWEDPWLAVAPGLRLRSRPPVAGAARVPDLALGSLLLGTLVAVAGLRKRVFIGLGIGVTGAVVLVCLPRGTGAPVPLSVLDGDAGSGAWLCVQSAWEELELPVGGPLCLEVDPARAALTFEVEHRSAGDDRWFAGSPGARLARIDALHAPAGRLDVGANELLDLDLCFVRGADGAWTERGAWRRGEPLPEPQGSAQPPGWLASLLPQGVGVLIGRVRALALESAAWGLPGPPPGDELWIRLTGF
jgi:hypothetical protein